MALFFLYFMHSCVFFSGFVSWVRWARRVLRVACVFESGSNFETRENPCTSGSCWCTILYLVCIADNKAVLPSSCRSTAVDGPTKNRRRRTIAMNHVRSHDTGQFTIYSTVGHVDGVFAVLRCCARALYRTIHVCMFAIRRAVANR